MKRFKSVLAFALVIVVLISLMGTNALASVPSDFVVVNGVLTEYNGPGGYVVIPGDLGITEIGGAFSRKKNISSVTIPMGVTSINTKAFTECSLTAVKLPGSLTKIGDRAFGVCRNLDSIVIPEGVTSIEGSAFEECKGLNTVEISDSVLTIGPGAFWNCSALRTLKLPGRLEIISNFVFYGCTALSEITIPESVTSIKGEAFSRCTALKSIIIPKSVTTIENSAFSGCTSLKSVKILGSSVTLGSNVFMNSGLEEPLFINNKGTLCYVPKSYTSYKIPDGVKTIHPNAFMDNTNITEVIIPESVTDIGFSAFYGCTALKSLTLPDGVTTIGDAAFFGCSALKSINIPKSLVSLGMGVFTMTGIETPLLSQDGKELYFVPMNTTEYTVPSGVAKIGTSAFWFLEKLTYVTLPYGLTEIGNYAFSDCTSLKSISIPPTVGYIGSDVFRRCISLTAISGAKGSYAEDFAVINSIAFTPITKTAVPTGSIVTVDGKTVKFEAYEIEGNNYFKLRDLAMALNGSAKQFNVFWNEEQSAIELASGKAYTAVGGELASSENALSVNAVLSAPKVTLDGNMISLKAYEIDGSNYVKLRDLAAVIDFLVTYDEASKSITISTDKSYQP